MQFILPSLPPTCGGARVSFYALAELLPVGDLFDFLQVILHFSIKPSAIMPRGGGNRRGVADPLNLEIFYSDEYASPGWNTLRPRDDEWWPLKQCKKYITASHIARLWYCDDMDAVRGWVSRWEFRITACALPAFARRYDEVMRWTREGQNLPTCTYSNLVMVYAEVMLGKRVDWETVTARNSGDITRHTHDIPTNVDWGDGLMGHAIDNGLLRQQVGGRESSAQYEAGQSSNTYGDDAGSTMNVGGLGGDDIWSRQYQEPQQNYRAWDDEEEHHEESGFQQQATQEYNAYGGIGAQQYRGNEDHGYQQYGRYEDDRTRQYGGFEDHGHQSFGQHGYQPHGYQAYGYPVYNQYSEHHRGNNHEFGDNRATIERMEGQIRHLTEELEIMRRDWRVAREEMDAHRSEIEDLRAQIARLEGRW